MDQRAVVARATFNDNRRFNQLLFGSNFYSLSRKNGDVCCDLEKFRYVDVSISIIYFILINCT
jgi:hypothetical protein